MLKLVLSVVLLPEEQPYRQVYQQFLAQHVLTIADYHFPILGENFLQQTRKQKPVSPVLPEDCVSKHMRCSF